MTLGTLATQIGAEALAPPQGKPQAQHSPGIEIDRVHASDLVSDMLRQASPTTLLVTHLVGPQLLRVAELMDVSGVCFVDGRVPEAEALARLAAHGVTVLVSPVDMFETCGRIHAAFPQLSRGEAPSGPVEP